MTVTPAQASAIATGVAVAILVFIIAFNLGRISVTAKARHCQPQTLNYSIPFKGGFNDF